MSNKKKQKKRKENVKSNININSKFTAVSALMEQRRQKGAQSERINDQMDTGA